MFSIPKISKKDIIVSGNDSIKTHIASCCHPIPGDEIIGFITKNNGIAVHRKRCLAVERLGERSIEVSWSDKINNRYQTELIIYTNTTKNILVNIASVADDNEISIQNIHLVNKIGNNIYKATVLVSNIEVLTKFINGLNKIKDIKKVDRLLV